jgi:putative endonuclease
MASGYNGTLYIGVTSDLAKRVWQHKYKVSPESFTSKYNVDKLVYFDFFDNVIDAIAVEKRLKHWKRQWKIDLINKLNLEWRDLYEVCCK